MPETIAEKTEFGYDTITDAMEMLITIYNTIPRNELEDTSMSFPALALVEVLEMFFAYVDQGEDIDVQTLMESVNMELSATFSLADDGEEPKIH